jgi:DHA2 family multidrug resistance protein-like MFS transporter
VDRLPAGIPAEAADAARDTLGGALAIAQTLPAELGTALVAAAQTAFIDAIHFVAAVAAIGAIATSIVAAAALRGVPARAEPAPEEGAVEPIAATD